MLSWGFWKKANFLDATFWAKFSFSHTCNFTKFLIDSKGQVIDRYAPTTKPDAIKSDIEQALANK